MNLREATRSYESWLSTQTKIVAKDLRAKHRAFAEAPFPLLRATFYRWMQLWNKSAGDLARAPKVLAVGDLHLENFGTWRDSEGRLIWGINDFDEAFPLPFTIDLVRLATSSHLAIREEHLMVRAKESCDAILEGYIHGLTSRGKPFVLAERNTWLWRLAVNELRNPKVFWKEQKAKCSPVPIKPSRDLVHAVRRMLPSGSGPVRVMHRTAGKGSLGRQRFLFLTEWSGGITAREAKPLVSSACMWAGQGQRSEIHYREIVHRAVRVEDPFVQLLGSWVIRRLAPDCSKIDLAHLPSNRDESKLLYAMGFETANIHLGTPSARRSILEFIRSLSSRWLDTASTSMARLVRRDWEDWSASR